MIHTFVSYFKVQNVSITSPSVHGSPHSSTSIRPHHVGSIGLSHPSCSVASLLGSLTSLFRNFGGNAIDLTWNLHLQDYFNLMSFATSLDHSDPSGSSSNATRDYDYGEEGDEECWVVVFMIILGFSKQSCNQTFDFNENLLLLCLLLIVLFYVCMCFLVLHLYYNIIYYIA